MAAAPSVSTNIAVPTWSLGTYHGTHTQIGASVALPIGTPNVTTSGDTLTGQSNTDVLTGDGLTGAITPVPGPPGKSGETVVASTHPDGTTSFEAFDNCACSFDGQSGTVAIVAYGTTSPSGWTHGTFIVDNVTPTAPATTTGLATLAGYGTFWGSGSTLQLEEHLTLTGTATTSCDGTQQMSDSQARFDDHGHGSNDGGWWHRNECQPAENH
jgi:hypothetical protein